MMEFKYYINERKDGRPPISIVEIEGQEPGDYLTISFLDHGEARIESNNTISGWRNEEPKVDSPKTPRKEWLMSNAKTIDELQETLCKAFGLSYISAESPQYKLVQALIQEEVTKGKLEAQTNAVAWAVGVVDKYHMLESGSGNEIDRCYKGVKNSIRREYESEVGVDPAPRYPIKATLQHQLNNSGGDDE